MKKHLFTITAFVSVFLFTSCSKEPVASFSTDKTSYKMGQTITFVNESKNCNEYSWNFGDGKKSTLENPTHSFATAGKFGVTLTVTGSEGTATVTDSIAILPDLTGFWLKTVALGSDFGVFKLTGTMNVVQHEDNSLTGSFVYSEGMGTVKLKSGSLNGNSVTIEWESPAFKFIGTLNAAGNVMAGTYTGANAASGTWSATKL